VYQDGSDKVRGIHFPGTLGTLLVFLEHANTVLKMLSYEGPLLLRVQMLRILGVPFLTFPYDTPTPAGAAPFDDTLSFELNTSSAAGALDPDAIVGEIAKTIVLGLNWASQAIGKDAVKALVAKAKEYGLFTTR
jgi:hypothetical protein